MQAARATPLRKTEKWVAVLPFILALGIFAFIAFTAIRLISYPDDGINNEDQGMILSVQPKGPTEGILQPEDVIQTLEGIPFERVRFDYNRLGKKGGDAVNLSIRRDGQTINTAYVLKAPSAGVIASRLMTILVALVFWGVGVVVEAYKPLGKSQPVVFLWFQVSALTLTVGSASSMGAVWASTLFGTLLWILGPLSVHFHTIFPQPILSKALKNYLRIMYLIALTGILLYLWTGASQLSSITLLLLAINLFVSVGLLVDDYRKAESPGVRGKIRLVLLGSTLAMIPFLILTLLPNALFGEPLIPYSYAFLLLGVLPLTYGYAIFRYRLIEIDQKVNRGATFILVFSILAGFYLVLSAILNSLLPEDLRTSPLINTILVMTLASIYIPLYRLVQRLVDQMFYGGWYDYRIGIRQLTENLFQINDLKLLAKTVSERLVNTFRLEEAVVFLRDQSGDFSVVESTFGIAEKERTRHQFPVLPRSSLTYLMRIGATERTELLQALSQVTLTPQELQLLRTEQIHLWAPIVGHTQIMGLLALGPKLGGDVYSADDLDILRVVVQQLSPIVENIHLVLDLKQHARELERRVEERTTELHDEKERVEAILANVGDGVIVTDLAGDILTVNRAFEKLSGYSVQEISGLNLFQMIVQENILAQVSAMRESLQEGRAWSDELISRRKNGKQYNVRFTIAPIHDRSGGTVGFVGSQTDITRQKELDRMKDAFISDVSHELRTPITNIGLYIELLKNAPLDRQKHYLTVVKGQSEVLTKLVEDILDLSRLTASKTRSVTYAPADLNMLIEQVILAHMPLAEAAGVKLDFYPEPDLPLISVEQNQIGRMLTNLITNSIRYAPQGEVQVTTAQADERICLTVCDTGIGIDPQDLPHIFDRFYRGRNVRQSEMHGTGLGLAIVKEIVDFHEGEIEMESELGKGSCLRIWLPIAQ